MNEDDTKRLMEYLETPKTIYEVCYHMTWGFTRTYNELNILVAGKEIRKVKTVANRTIYHIVRGWFSA